MGYRTVALSSSDAKKQFATDLGATDYVGGGNQVEALKKMGGADLIVVTAPSPKLIKPLPFALAPRGKLLILSRM
jgi:D-arabinose 1-dehydrogenase-like Zn-dependent alcohol dehydrogenase